MAPKPVLELQTIGNSKILRTRFLQAPIELNEEMEDIEEVGGMTNQPKTSRQQEISLTLLPVLRS
jgi:hypothetical protein